MPSLTVTFDFASDAQGFAPVPNGPLTVMSYDASDGNPPGSLKSRLAGKNASESSNAWRREMTFEEMGIPAGSTITGVHSASLQSKCTEFNHAGRCKRGPVIMTGGFTQFNLANEAYFRGVDADWVTSTGDDTIFSAPSSQASSIAIFNDLATGGSNDAAVSLLQDQLTFTIEYV